MSSRLLLNASLFLIIAVLATIALLSSGNDKAVPEQIQKKQDISSIIIEYDKQRIELLRKNNYWVIQQPVQIAADDFRINTILSLVASLPTKSYPLEQKDLKRFVLDPPLATLTLNQNKYLFGTVSAVNQRRYVYTDNKLYLVDDTFYPLLTSGYKNLMRRQLLPPETTITSLRFEQTSFTQNQQGSWQYNKDTSVSGDEIKAYIDNWQHIQAYAVSRSKPPYNGKQVLLETNAGRFIFFIEKTDSGTLITSPERELTYQFDISAYSSLIEFNPSDEK